jgi:asparagine synthase (glutamine-hydrolysing)
MAAALRHRGPDGHGVYVDDLAGLAHSRLSIIDRAGGAQPMCNEDATLWVTFNGEIFNYIELRAELEGAGHVFRSRSDTETIVHAVEQWGVEAFARFNGQFAIALWNSRSRELWLARDPVGIAPLFLARRDGMIIFGSESKAIFASGRVSPRPDPLGIAQAMLLWSPAAPTTCFEGVEALAPGTLVKFDADLGETATRFASLRFTPDDSSSQSIEEASEELEERLRQAVALRLRADVPVGAYLSGGLDSSVIAQLVTLAESSPLETFSLRFEDRQFDEGAAQHRMARLLGTRHHEIVVGAAHIRDELPRVIRHCETPLTRTGPAPMFLLSRLVRELGFRVVLTGEGADEFLGGYDVFKEAKIRAFWARQQDSTARPALLARVHPYVAGARSPNMWREFFRRGFTSLADPFYSHRPRWENAAWGLRFLAPDVRAAASPERLIESAAAGLPDGWDSSSVLSRAQTIEAKLFMSSYLLASQGDRALMANSVEGRFPFLDPAVTSFGMRLPDRLKLLALREKRVLRKVASKSLPEEVWRRRKWPYRAPIAGALLGPSAPDYVREVLSPSAIASCTLLDAKSATAMAARGLRSDQLSEREEMSVLGIITTQLWLREFTQWSDKPRLDRVLHETWPAPDVFEDQRTRADQPATNRVPRTAAVSASTIGATANR